MNWNLFANRKFQVKYKDEVYPIYGYVFSFGGGKLILDNHAGFIEAKGNDCTLIARPISDMTDEEIHRATEHMIRPHSMSFDVRKLLNNKDDFRLALNLISIGVLPKIFEEGFKTGTVINVNEL